MNYVTIGPYIAPLSRVMWIEKKGAAEISIIFEGLDTCNAEYTSVQKRDEAFEELARKLEEKGCASK